MKTRREAIESIARNWRLDARQEDNAKYFYFYDEVRSILAGDKCYVIGRKGSGKTAICEYVINLCEPDSFQSKLSFKSFPFNELYRLQDQSYTPPNQYITIWKYLIYATVCKLMCENEAVDAEVSANLRKLFPKNDDRQLNRRIKEWTSLNFGASFVGSGVNVGIDRAISDMPSNWVDRVDVLEDIIKQYAGDSRYYVVFDELDEDYKSVEANNEGGQYITLLTSLFKAVQDILATFSKSSCRIRPIIFLRDDIYRQIKDSDKNKWTDFEIDIEWTEQKLKRLLAYRIAQDFGVEADERFDPLWNMIFPANIKYGNNNTKSIGTFDYIAKSTQLRPRDFIYFIKCCCEECRLGSFGKVSASVVKKVDRAFSTYLQREITDEIYPILPEIEEIFHVISNLRKWNFRVSEFVEEYERHLKAGTVTERNVNKVLDTLFNFSVIGNQDRYQPDRQYFKYKHTNMTLNREENIIVHRGLFKAFQLQ